MTTAGASVTKNPPGTGAARVRAGGAMLTGEDRRELARAAMGLSSRRFVPAAACVGLVYLVAALHQLILPGGAEPWLPALLSAAAAWACYVLGFLVHNHLVPLRIIHAAAIGLVAIVLAQQTALVRLTGAAPDPLPYMLLLIGTGMFFVSAGWLAVALTMIWLSWLGLVSQVPPVSGAGAGGELVGGVSLSSAVNLLLRSPSLLALELCTVIGLVVFAVQARFFRQTEQVRLNRRRLADQTAEWSAPAATEEPPFHQLTAASLDPVVVHENGLILEASEAFGEMLGRPAAELAGGSLLDLVAPETRTQVSVSLFLGNLAPAETLLLRSDGTRAPVEVLSKNTRHRGRRVTVTTLRHLGERRQLAATLAQEQQRTEQSYRLQAALAALDVAVDRPEQLDVFLNEVATLARDTLSIQGGVWLVLAEEGTGRLRTASQVADENVGSLAANTLLRYRGATAWVLANRQPLVVARIENDPFAEEHHFEQAGIQSYAAFPLIEEGRCLGVLVVLETRSRTFHSGELNFLSALAHRAALAVVKVGLFEQLRQNNALLEAQRAELQVRNAELAAARDAAEAASRAKTKFFDTISHELRTPMHGVLGMTHLLMGTDLTEEQREYAATVQSSAESLLKMIDDVLEFTQLDAVNSPLQTEPLEVHEFLTGLVETLAPRARNKGLTLAADLDATVPRTIISDRSRLRHLLQILLGNAIKFTLAGGVTLRARGEVTPGRPARLRVEISDTGPGFEADLLPRLFEPFNQADGSMSRRHGGLGLGLALARQIARRLGGDIGAHNGSAGGAVVWFTVPFRSEDTAASPAS
jgi:PAS domain S-box-containing protein